jgi:hypothetical protein
LRAFWRGAYASLTALVLPGATFQISSRGGSHMIIFDTTTATPTATRFRMPALLGASTAHADRQMAAGTSYPIGGRVPASVKGVFSDVRAWSPPVLE